MYIDTRAMTDEERSRKRRQIMMQQVSYQSDLKKLERQKMELQDALHRLEQERNRIEMYIKENKDESRILLDRETFLQDELHHVKKELIELG